MNALIIVDMQNDFVEGGSLAVPGGKELVPLINSLQPRFDLVVATQDWHPAEHGSFAASHSGKEPFEKAQLHGLPQTLWPIHCVENTPGADFVPGLDRERWATVIRKGIDPQIDSYSGFFDNRQRRDTGLNNVLRAHGVTDVYVAGLATDYCVKYTVLGALQLKFSTWLIEDACRGVNVHPQDSAHAVEEMKRAGARLIRADAIRPFAP